jgi:UDP-N-acetylmuramoyl-tripeptide--D-alanyl-D-alanine ligase
MLELGAGSEKAHRELGAVAAKTVQRLFLIGPQAGAVAEGALLAGLSREQVTVAPDHEALEAGLLSWLSPGDLVLVKGSRGMRMEKVAQAVRERFAAGEGGTD